MDLLRGTGLRKKFISKDKEILAVNDISFTLHENEFLAIVGESGSGKSSLLRLIAGLERADEGHLFYRDEEYTSKKCGYAGKFLQMVFQDAYSSFDPKMKVVESIKECNSAECEAELKRLLEAALLDEALLYKRPRELSGGECQRMSIVRALNSGADILLCDEITSALDVSTQAQIVKAFKELREKRDFAAIFVSHDIALMGMLCENIMVMKDGVCVEEGETKAVIENPRDEYTKLLIENARKQSL
ncbi:ABC transporter ATP-binding protein [Butyrivibrio sp. AE2032]|uniref:ABC transporter ATP-binding protein n=1 Tax=Butyrivibrio sp. AE2032 TaxID=1458463 RepID=UPI00054F5D2E|nr:ABC transporter ATP-binding protein [Butyrivibrio sp. AE2032]